MPGPDTRPLVVRLTQQLFEKHVGAIGSARRDCTYMSFKQLLCHGARSGEAEELKEASVVGFHQLRSALYDTAVVWKACRCNRKCEAWLHLYVIQTIAVSSVYWATAVPKKKHGIEGPEDVEDYSWVKDGSVPRVCNNENKCLGESFKQFKTQFG